MRRLVWLIGIIALVWGLWWWVASTGMQRGTLAWLADRRAAGWQAEIAEATRTGFPMRLHLALADMQLADPATGIAMALPQLDIETPIYWPGYVRVSVPSDLITLASPQRRILLSADKAVAQLRLHPGTALQLETMGLTAGNWTLMTRQAPIMSAENLTLTMTQQDTPEIYRFDLRADDLIPGLGARQTLRIPNNWPRAFDRFTAEMTVTFDRPWDRSALEQHRPQPRAIKLRLADAKWADLHFLMAADLTVDQFGRGTGKISLKVDNWPAFLDMAQGAGVLPQNIRDQFEKFVSNFAKLSGNPNALDVTITLKDGAMSAGFIPLGPAPLLILR